MRLHKIDGTSDPKPHAEVVQRTGVEEILSDGTVILHRTGAIGILDDWGPTESPWERPKSYMVFLRPNTVHDVRELLMKPEGGYVLHTAAMARMETPVALSEYAAIFNDQYHGGRKLCMNKIVRSL